jgi:predicted dehydrogenase
VIATPSALHAEQSVAALGRGLAVFCQKPLGRTAGEVGAVVRAARTADSLLDADLSYRFTEAGRAVRRLVRSGELGEIFAVDLAFHNAYGPDKPWFQDRRLAGGGCLIDLGTHLVDLALLCLGPARVASVSGRVLAGGRPIDGDAVEDYAAAQIVLETGAVIRLACSWRLPAGRDAIIEAAFYGTRGGARLGNVDGSFHDLVAERMIGTRRETLVAPPDAWGGRAAVDWATRLADGARFDPAVAHLIEVAATLDRIYAGA